MRILVRHTHSLYAKATIPVIVHLVDGGHDVVVARRRDRLRGFSQRYVLSNPTRTTAVDRESLRYVARLIGYERDWARVEDRVEVGRPRGRFDVVVGTTKDLDRLAGAAARAVALGYQHMPFLVGASGALPPSLPRPRTALLEENPFTAEHGFLRLLAPFDVAAAGFTFIDRVLERRPAVPGGDVVLVLHSGGWRGIESEPGEARETAYAKQEALLERACVPVVEAGRRPVVKVHPLRARDHDLPDLREIAGRIERRRGLAPGSIELLGPDDWLWDAAFAATLVVGYGSSTLYELWAAGLRNAVVLDFEGRARSERFTLFPSVVVGSHNEYVSLVRDPTQLRLDPLTDRIATAYAELHDGRAAERACEAILG